MNHPPDDTEPPQEAPEALDPHTHALLTPWPLSDGLRLWCGRSASDEDVQGHTVTAKPQNVGCPACRDAMRTAFRSLGMWVPLLPPD